MPTRVLFSFVIATLWSALFPALTQAQAPPASTDVQVLESAECPDDAGLRAFPKVTLPSAGIGTTVVKRSDAELFESGALDSPPTLVSVKFDAPLTVFGFNIDRSKLFVRTVPSKRDPAEPDPGPKCGWVSADQILMPRGGAFTWRNNSPQPLQMRDISELAKETKSYLNVKAVIHDLSIAGDSAVAAFAEPEEDQQDGKRKQINAIKMFDTFLVFDKFHLPTVQPGKESRYWLLGKQLKDNSVSLTGWVRQRDVVIWPSRLAVQWNEEATAVGFTNPEFLKRNVNPIVPPQKIAPVDFPDQITRRFPVLAQMPPPEEVAQKLLPGTSLEERLAIGKAIVEYYRIATPGEACQKTNRADCLKARDIDRAREKVVIAQKAASRMDVLILIDATESMERYFASTVTSIQHFIKQAGDLEKTVDIRFGISLYGDYRSKVAGVAAVDYNEVVRFFRPTPTTVGTTGPLAPLLSNPQALIFKDLHPDKLEAPFAAIIRASQASKWRPDKEVPLRFIIHLADAGNRDKGKTSTETVRARFPGETPSPSSLREVLGEDDVVDALRKSNVIYVPVAVLGGTEQSASIPIWNHIFQQQANGILTQMGDRSPIAKAEVTYSDEGIETRDGRVKKTVGAILASVNTSLRVGNRFKYEAECRSGAQTERCKDLAKGLEENPGIIKLTDYVAAKAAGLTELELRNIFSREQSIVTVFSPARSKEGKDTFTHWVVLEEQEFKSLRNVLTALCQNMGQQDAKNPVVKALKEITGYYADEEFTEFTPGEFLNKKLGIPNLERTDFSSRTPDEIENAFRAWRSGDRETWENWHLRMCRASMFTQLMEDNLKASIYAILCDLKGRCSVAPNAKRPFRWSVQVSTGAPVYYVPLDILP